MFFMPKEVCDDIAECFCNHIQSHGYANFAAQFKEAFEIGQSKITASKKFVASAFISALCFLGLIKTLENPGYHSSAFLAGMIAAPTGAWSFYSSDIFDAPYGKFNFEALENGLYRAHLVDLYHALGGEQDYLLGFNDRPNCNL